jgi:3-isopropylmalate/(R)-2-methylmalate dehydratase large subunit
MRPTVDRRVNKASIARGMARAAAYRPPMPRTLYDKLWNAHVVAADGAGQTLLYIDRHLLHEVSTPQSFEMLRSEELPVHRPDTQLAVADHSVPTGDRASGIADPQAAAQVALLERNCAQFGIDYLSLASEAQGIVHVIGPEQGFTLPGVTLVCGDSHSSTHGAFGALAFGIGASECGIVMATQCLWQTRARTMRVEISGSLGAGVSAKDVALTLIGRIGAGGAAGYAIEFAGEAVRAMSMDARMTLCNMAIEAGSRTGLVAPDETTFAYLKGRPRAPRGADWDAAVSAWRDLKSDEGAVFDRELRIEAGAIAPQVTFGTSPDLVAGVDQTIPDAGVPQRTLDYMDVRPGMPLAGLAIDHAFIGSCTNGRIEDLRAAAAIVRDRRVAAGVRALVVPGSGAVKRQAEREGLDRLFREAGFEWREPGCSLCVAMNDDRLPAGARCASTSNRNFEGRQGAGARTHLMSPAMVAAAAIAGRIVDVRTFAS